MQTLPPLGRPAPTGRLPHQHSCGHDCTCPLTPLDSPNCVACRHDAFTAYRAALKAAA